VAWVYKWPGYEARFQASVEGVGGGGGLRLFTNRLKDTEQRRQVDLGHVSKGY
jgi:hypothetical protein